MVKDDENIEIKVKLSTYYAMFLNLGGFRLFLPFLGLIYVYNQVEQNSSKEIGKWANKIAKNQQADFYTSCLTIFGMAIFSGALIIAKTQIKLKMKMAAGLKFFKEMLDRIMEAPINLYFDITSIGAIQSKFTRDLGAVEGSFFDVL